MTAIYIDGEEVTNYAIEGSVTRKLNRPSEAQIRLPLNVAVGGAGSRLKIHFDEFASFVGGQGAGFQPDGLFFHGFILHCETSCDEDVGYVTYNAMDPTEIWSWRPFRDVDGDYSKPDLITEFPNAPTIIQQMLLNSEESFTGATGDPFPDGELFLDIESGPFPILGADMSGAPVDFPMTMAEVANLLVSTGELDILIFPIDSGGDMGRVECYHGDFGTDRTGSVIFEFATGARNVRNIRHTEDMANTVNRLRYLLGPRVGTKDDPAGEQHWGASIDGLFAPITLGRQAASRAEIGTRYDIRVWDGDYDLATELWARLWNIEAWLRAWPMRMTMITPTRDTQIGSFDIGDLVTVNAPLVVNRPTLTTANDVTGNVQRIYEYTISWTDDSVLELSELGASPTQEGYGQ